ncbi:MAG: hypothetical protein HOP10_00495 [Chitinophagaceae bacterium]|nr:hypothetical protein [Chitinophagaceae bacterium]
MRFKFLILFLLISIFGKSQIKKSKWNNHNKGTVAIHYNAIHVYPKDTLATGISNNLLINISVRLFELTSEGCRQIEGKIKINDREFYAYDSTNFIDKDGEKNLGNYFSMWAAEGEYIFLASVNNDYYSVKTEKYFLSRYLAYRIDFYLVRKDALKN